MGRIGCGLDNATVESFFGSMQIELDRRRWPTRDELATALFDWIEAFYNSTRRHSALGYLSPIAYERAHTLPPPRHDHHTNPVRRTGEGHMSARMCTMPRPYPKEFRET